MTERHEGKGGKILSMTVKRARRVQEKVWHFFVRVCLFKGGERVCVVCIRYIVM